MEKLEKNKEDPFVKLILEKLKLINQGLYTNSIKMTNSANLIDYFVHDMLDYTILSNTVDNFVKDNSTFDIAECINQIYDMLEDKIKLKKIKFEISIIGFDSGNRIYTDKKRLQQVLLNLLSNAIKFTDREGSVQIQAVNISYSFVKIFVRDSGIGIKKED